MAARNKLWTIRKDFINNAKLLQCSLCSQHLQVRDRHTQAASFGFLFDIDGVIVRGKKLLPKAAEAFKLLTDSNGKFRLPALFVTNAGNTLRQKKAEQLSDWLGVQVEDDQVVMSHSPLKMFRQFQDKHILVSGQGPILEIAKNLGFTNATSVDSLRHSFPTLDMVDHRRRKSAPCAFEKYFPRIEGIILFGEPVRWETHLQLIIDVLLTNGLPAFAPKEIKYPHLPILACNMDLLWMSEACMPRFGHGCFLVALESMYQKITGRELKYTALIGKPSEITYHHADYLLRQQAKARGINHIHTIYCIGDNPETDIYGGNLYNRYLQKRNKSQQKRNMAKMVKQVAAGNAGQQVTNINDTDDEDDIEDADTLALNDGEEYVDNGHFAESCQSILVCTGVFNSENDYVSYHGQRPSNHNHRDFVLDAELKQPTYVAEDVLDAVKLVFEKEMYK